MTDEIFDFSAIFNRIAAAFQAGEDGVGAYLALTVPDCGDAPACDPMASWERQGKLLFDLVITAVLPIVTLMLGFYFGTESKGGEQPTGKA